MAAGACSSRSAASRAPPTLPRRVEAGADAVGFVFWTKSPRGVDAETARGHRRRPAAVDRARGRLRGRAARGAVADRRGGGARRAPAPRRRSRRSRSSALPRRCWKAVRVGQGLRGGRRAALRGKSRRHPSRHPSAKAPGRDGPHLRLVPGPRGAKAGLVPDSGRGPRSGERGRRHPGRAARRRRRVERRRIVARDARTRDGCRPSSRPRGRRRDASRTPPGTSDPTAGATFPRPSWSRSASWRRPTRRPARDAELQRGAAGPPARLRGSADAPDSRAPALGAPRVRRAT